MRHKLYRAKDSSSLMLFLFDDRNEVTCISCEASSDLITVENRRRGVACDFPVCWERKSSGKN